jgi:hypothetical protein
MILAWVQAGETDAGDCDEASFLREHLDVAERFEQRHVLARNHEDPRCRTGEERLEGESAARVPEVSGDQSCPAFRAVPEQIFRHHGKPITRFCSRISHAVPTERAWVSTLRR